VYTHGSLVGLSATPAPGWRFAGWSGDHQGTEDPLSVVMDRDRHVTATFQPIEVLKWIGAGDGTSWIGYAQLVGGPTTDGGRRSGARRDDGEHRLHREAAGGASSVSIRKLTVAPDKRARHHAGAALDQHRGHRTRGWRLRREDRRHRAAERGGAAQRIEGDVRERDRDAIVGQPSSESRNGARYVHASTRSANGIAPRLVRDADTAAGIFEYDRARSRQLRHRRSGITYGSLVLNRSDGGATYTAAGAESLTVRAIWSSAPGSRWPPP
jgi:uncharacterized repeat protein (TIGR02543 family)